MCALLGMLVSVYLHAQKVADFNLVFHEKGTDSWSSMPLGNGEISSQVWTDKDGKLQLYIGTTGSRDGMDNVIKVGKLTIQFEPNILANSSGYTEALLLDEGTFRIKNKLTDIRFRVDANQPQLIISGASAVPVGMCCLPPVV